MRHDATWYKVDPETGCHIWQSAKNKNGYGMVAYKGTTTQAHIKYYEEAYGPVPEGMVLDHMCETKLCVRPDPKHVWPNTREENTARAQRRTHCSKCGNPYDKKTRQGWNKCGPCTKAYQKAYQAGLRCA